MCKGYPVALAWFSPDCKHFSKAKGGKPKDKSIRGLAWVALRWAALVAADYGAPTMRKRFFLIARSDGKPIVWPDPTHGPAESIAVKTGMQKPYAGAYTQMDFSLPCPSIFDTAEEIKEKYGIKAVRPLAPKTMERIARGLKKFVIDNAEPFIVQVNHSGAKSDYCRSMDKPLSVITSKHGFGIVEPMLIQYHSETSGSEVRGQSIDQPLMTVDSSNRYGLVMSFLHKYYDGGDTEAGDTLHNPLPTITAGDGHFAEVRAFLIKYYGNVTGQDIKKPLDTITSHDRFGLVTIHGVDYQIVDIGLRMLEPKELYGCQGFPKDYIIDHDNTGKTYPRSEQVKRCGNAVCPPIPAALVKANLPELCTCKRMPNIRISEEQTGQMRLVT